VCLDISGLKNLLVFFYYGLGSGWTVVGFPREGATSGSLIEYMPTQIWVVVEALFRFLETIAISTQKTANVRLELFRQSSQQKAVVLRLSLYGDNITDPSVHSVCEVSAISPSRLFPPFFFDKCCLRARLAGLSDRLSLNVDIDMPRGGWKKKFAQTGRHEKCSIMTTNRARLRVFRRSLPSPE
jgi:hypothetical protein